MCTGIAEFQKLVEIPETGVFDKGTAKNLKEPHCRNHSSRNDYIKLPIFTSDGEIRYSFDRYSDRISISDVRKTFSTAFRMWSAHCPLPYDFKEDAPHRRPDIRTCRTWHYEQDGPRPDPVTGLIKPEERKLEQVQ